MICHSSDARPNRETGTRPAPRHAYLHRQFHAAADENGDLRVRRHERIDYAAEVLDRKQDGVKPASDVPAFPVLVVELGRENEDAAGVGNGCRPV
ncbi:hypothetical protein DL764_006776 [Monosporascus ibericus]|uniref:Uncharacterized protein n=1 Tax=Monosporascus ibericus TaxID=155417 RepID=A0A4Q4T7H1_9PEZI|nr:hypothetical protein DL764_006776 [Monosporascus ibericus]